MNFRTSYSRQPSSEKSSSVDSSSSLQYRGVAKEAWQDSSESMHRLQEDRTKSKHAAAELPAKAAAGKWNGVGKTVKISIQ